MLAVPVVAYARPKEPEKKAKPADGAKAASLESNGTLDEVLRAVRQALKEEDDAKLRAFGAGTNPEAWMIAEGLVASGDAETARLFAQRLDKKGVGNLVAYLARPRDGEETKRRFTALRALGTLGRASDWSSIVSADNQPTTDEEDLVSVATLLEVAQAQHRLRELDASADLARRALERAKSLGWLHGQQVALDQLTSLSMQRGRFEEARQYGETGVQLAEARDLPSVLAPVLGRLGVIYLRLRKGGKSIAVMERAIALFRESHQWVMAGGALLNLGNVDAEAHRPESALPRFDEAYAIAKKTGHRRLLHLSLLSRARIHLRLGKITQARADIEEVERLVNDGGTVRDRGNVFFVRAELGVTLGELSQAIDLFSQAANAYSKAKDVHFERDSQSQCATACLRVGRYGEALVRAKRAVDLATRMGHKAGIAEALIGLARAYEKCGQFERALGVLAQAARVCEDSGYSIGRMVLLGVRAHCLRQVGHEEEAHAASLEHIGLATMLGRSREALATRLALARTRVVQGDVKEGAEANASGLDVAKQRGWHHLVSYALLTSCLVAEAQRDVQAELATTEAVLEHESPTTTPQIRTLSRWYRANALAHARRLEEALAMYDEAMDFRERLGEGLGDSFATTLRSTWSRLINTSVDAAVQAKSMAHVWRYLERGRAGSLLDGLSARAFMREEPSILPFRDAEASARKKLVRARARQRTAGQQGVSAEQAKWKQEVERAAVLHEQTLSDLQTAMRRGVHQNLTHTLSLTEFQRTLEERDVFLNFFTVNGKAKALVVQSQSARLVDLGPREALTQLINRSFPKSTPFVDDKEIPTLQTRLWARLNIPQATTRAFIVTSGATARVSFALLAPPSCDVCAVPSGTVIEVLRKQPNSRGAKVLALGDPVYGNTDLLRGIAYRSPSDLHALAPLPATRKEVAAIADVALLGKHATETRLWTELAKRDRWRAVHFACHGMIDPLRPDRSALALSSDDASDGFLTSIEVIQQRMPSELVVLSACDTARGTSIAGEGLVGLSRAFMHAGTPRVICSLWRVDDEATRALMTHFYKVWNANDNTNTSATRALRQAQDTIRKQPKWKHPRYWAAWMVWGIP